MTGARVSVSISYRLAVTPDLPFIYGAWLSSFRTAHAAGVVRMARYAEVYKDTIGHLLLRPGVDVVVAEGEGVLSGFLCAERGGHVPVVHYCYVEKPARGHGIARGMFRAAGIDPLKPFAFTFKTALVSRLKPKMPLAKYDPLQARFDVAEETA